MHHVTRYCMSADILVTLVYWKLDEKIWAILTLLFLVVPSIIMQVSFYKDCGPYSNVPILLMQPSQLHQHMICVEISVHLLTRPVALKPPLSIG